MSGYKPPPQQKGLFYGWVIVAISFLTLAMVYSVRYSFAFLFVAVLEEFEWSRANTAAIMGVSVLAEGLCLPAAGAMVDRFGPRKVMPLGALLVALSTASLSQANALWQFYLLFGVLMGVGVSFTGWVPITTVLSRWFGRKRGKAFGIMAAGAGMTYILGSATQPLIATLGWRGAYLTLGGAVALIVVPLLLILQRGHPQDKGLLPDGDAQPLPQNPVARTEPLVVDQEWTERVWTPRQALKTLRFWFLFATTLFLWGMGMQLVFAHHAAFITDIGFSTGFAALVYFSFGLAYSLGNLGGFISDRLGREATIALGSFLAMLAVAALIGANFRPHPQLLFLYALLFGLGTGVNSPALGSAIADVFQGKHFGVINGLITMGFGLGGAVAPWLGGVVFDQLQSYTLAFLSVILSFVVGLVCLVWASPRRVRTVPGRLRTEVPAS